MAERPKRVALFVTCLADHFFPQVGEAVVRVLHHAGLARRVARLRPVGVVKG